MTTPHKLPVPDRIRVTTPAAGANFTFTNSDGGLLLVRSVSFVFTTSAAVANRFVGLTVSADVDTWLRTSAGIAQAASLAVGYSAFGSANSAAVSTAGVCLPWRDEGVLLRQGHVLASVTAAIDAADQYSGIVLDVLRYLPDYLYQSGPYLAAYNLSGEGP